MRDSAGTGQSAGPSDEKLGLARLPTRSLEGGRGRDLEGKTKTSNPPAGGNIEVGRGEMSLTELTEGTEGCGWIEFLREGIQSKNLGR